MQIIATSQSKAISPHTTPSHHECMAVYGVRGTAHTALCLIPESGGELALLVSGRSDSPSAASAAARAIGDSHDEAAEGVNAAAEEQAAADKTDLKETADGTL